MNARIWAGTALLRCLGTTWRVDVPPHAATGAPGRNVIFAFWHSSLLLLAWSHRRRNVHVLVSQHRDGEWIARILERLGYGLVRGSSRRGGVEALFQLAQRLDSGLDVAITVDGPVGPRYTVHPGVVLLARRTGRPILPVIPTFDRGTMLDTWDKLRVAAPFASVRVRYGDPISVAADLDARGVARVQADVERALRDATREAEARRGRTIDFEDVQDRRSYWERRSEAPRPPAPLRWAARAHALGRRLDGALRPRPKGRGGRPWIIGVGNLEAGGTGKTPCVAALAAALAASGRAVAVLTRGHGGALGAPPQRVTAAALPAASDETRLLFETLPAGVPILVARDKRAGLAMLRAEAGLDIVVVDDAFQTAGLEVDRHLVLLDATAPFGNGWLLPAGRLREGPGALRRADAVLFTRAAPGAPVPVLPEAAGLPCFVARESFAGFRRPRGAAVDGVALRGAGVVLLSGIGRPQAFEALARDVGRQQGFRVRRAVRIGDHAPLEKELRRLIGRLEALECGHIVLTAKDAARLQAAAEWNEPLLVLEQRLEFPEMQRLIATLVADH